MYEYSQQLSFIARFSADTPSGRASLIAGELKKSRGSFGSNEVNRVRHVTMADPTFGPMDSFWFGCTADDPELTYEIRTYAPGQPHHNLRLCWGSNGRLQLEAATKDTLGIWTFTRNGGPVVPGDFGEGGTRYGFRLLSDGCALKCGARVAVSGSGWYHTLGLREGNELDLSLAVTSVNASEPR